MGTPAGLTGGGGAPAGGASRGPKTRGAVRGTACGVCAAAGKLGLAGGPFAIVFDNSDLSLVAGAPWSADVRDLSWTLGAAGCGMDLSGAAAGGIK